MTTHTRRKKLGKSDQRHRHTRWGIPQGLDCLGRTLRKTRSCMDSFMSIIFFQRELRQKLTTVSIKLTLNS
jgi:hypothetical protein